MTLTSTQLLGIRPTLISCVCVVSLKNKQLHKQPKTDVTLHSGQDVVSLSMHLFMHSIFFSSNGNWSTHEAFWSASQAKFISSTQVFCLSVCPAPPFLPPSSFFSTSLFLSLFCLCLTLSDGFSVSRLGDWFQLWMAVRRAACTLVCSKDCTLLWLCDELLAL